MLAGGFVLMMLLMLLRGMLFCYVSLSGGAKNPLAGRLEHCVRPE